MYVRCMAHNGQRRKVFAVVKNGEWGKLNGPSWLNTSMGEVSLKKIHFSGMEWASVARVLLDFGAFLRHE